MVWQLGRLGLSINTAAAVWRKDLEVPPRWCTFNSYRGQHWSLHSLLCYDTLDNTILQSYQNLSLNAKFIKTITAILCGYFCGIEVYLCFHSDISFTAIPSIQRLKSYTKHRNFSESFSANILMKTYEDLFEELDIKNHLIGCIQHTSCANNFWEHQHFKKNPPPYSW